MQDVHADFDVVAADDSDDGVAPVTAPEAAAVPAAVVSASIAWPPLRIRVVETVGIHQLPSSPQSAPLGSSVQIVGTVSVEFNFDDRANDFDPEQYSIALVPPSLAATEFHETTSVEERKLRMHATRWCSQVGAGVDLDDDGSSSSSDDGVGIAADIQWAKGVHVVPRMNRDSELSIHMVRTFKKSSSGSTSPVLGTYTVKTMSADDLEMVTPARCRTQWKLQEQAVAPPQGNEDGEATKKVFTVSHLFKCLVHLEPPSHRGLFQFESVTLFHTPYIHLSDGAAPGLSLVVAQPLFDANLGEDEETEGAFGWMLNPAGAKQVFAGKFVQQIALDEDAGSLVQVQEMFKMNQRIYMHFKARGCLSGCSVVCHSSDSSGTGGIPVVYSSRSGIVVFDDSN